MKNRLARFGLGIAVAGFALASTAPVRAQIFSTPLLQKNQGRPENNGMPSGGVDGVGVEQKLDEMPDLDATFTDQDGKSFPFRQLLDGKRPVLVTFNFSDCPSVCNAQLTMLSGALKEVDLTAGKDFRLVTVSLDHTENIEKAKAGRTRYLEELGREGADWTFLRADEKNLLRFTNSVGYRFKWTEDANKIAHFPVLMFLTPEGKIGRYIGGAQYFPTILRMSIVETSEGRVGSLYDDIFLLCFNYDAGTNSYVLFANNFMLAGGVISIAALGWFLWRMFRIEVARRRHSGSAEVVNG